MRVNIYCEEMTDRIEIVEKDGFTGLRMYLYMPVTQNEVVVDEHGLGQKKEVQIKGPFIHHEGDDDSSAITFWGKKDLRNVLEKALVMLDDYHYTKNRREGV